MAERTVGNHRDLVGMTIRKQARLNGAMDDAIADLVRDDAMLAERTLGAAQFRQGEVAHTDVPDFALIGGVPGRLLGWMSRFGERLDLPRSGGGECTCPNSGERYVLAQGRVRLVDAA